MRIRNYIVGASLLLLGACSTSSTIEGLTLVNETIASTSRAAKTALEQDKISVQTACKIEVYGRLARAAVDGGYEAYITGDNEGAEEHLETARFVLSGVSAEAANQVEKECN